LGHDRRDAIKSCHGSVLAANGSSERQSVKSTNIQLAVELGTRDRAAAEAARANKAVVAKSRPGHTARA
jgi:hypothetical protein